MGQKNLPNAEVEQCWIDWEHISHIEYVYHISRDAMYRHAHALGLFEKRKKKHHEGSRAYYREGGGYVPEFVGCGRSHQCIHQTQWLGAGGR